MENVSKAKYPKIKSIEITNFMSIEDSKIEFSDNNIVSLVGYNDTGKSAVTRLMEIMFYNAYPNEQVRYIKEGHKFWECLIEFEDGVLYRRLKENKGKNLFELSKEGTVLYTNLLDSGKTAAISGLPQPIEDYLGVIKEEITGETLNVRRNTDTLFLINTSGGDNYKILNSVLKSETLVKATTNLTKDKNGKQKKLQNSFVRKSVLGGNILQSKHITEKDLDSITETLDTTKTNINQFEQLDLAVNQYNLFNSIHITEEVPEIDIQKIGKISEVMKYQKAKNIPILKEVPTIDTRQKESIETVFSNLNKLESIKVLKPIEEDLNTDRIDTLQKIYGSLQSLNEVKVNKEVSEIDSKKVNQLEFLNKITDEVENFRIKLEELKEVELELKKINEELKEIEKETDFVVCPNCNIIILDEHTH